MNLAFLIDNAPPLRSTGDDTRAVFDDDRLVHALKNPPAIEEAQKPELADLITQILESARSNTVRNAAALLLTDLIGRDATDRIVNVIRQPGMPQSAGSLLFALNDVEAHLPLDLIADVIRQGSLEAQGEALTFLEDARVDDFTASEFTRAETTLRDTADNAASNQTKEAASMALEYLEDLAAKAMPNNNVRFT